MDDTVQAKIGCSAYRSRALAWEANGFSSAALSYHLLLFRHKVIFQREATRSGSYRCERCTERVDGKARKRSFSMLRPPKRSPHGTRG